MSIKVTNSIEHNISIIDSVYRHARSGRICRPLPTAVLASTSLVKCDGESSDHGRTCSKHVLSLLDKLKAPIV